MGGGTFSVGGGGTNRQRYAIALHFSGTLLILGVAEVNTKENSNTAPLTC